MSHYFGEKKTEYSAKDKDEIPVWESPKFKTAREFAVAVIDSNQYGLEDSDFWILMNRTGSGKMGYTGLILSHNGCLKINDHLAKEDRFRPECVTIDKEGFNKSLVFTYCCPEQGIYEVGEFSAENGKNGYPYAMAFKRMYDRVVLKISKLAYNGIYSDSESDEFAEHIEAGEEIRNGGKTEKKKPEPKTEIKDTGVALPFAEPQLDDSTKAALAHTIDDPKFKYPGMRLGDIYKQDPSFFGTLSVYPDEYIRHCVELINTYLIQWNMWRKNQK